MLTLGTILGRGRTEPREARARWSVEMADIAVYAVGDVHGCLDLLLALEEEIAADAAQLPGDKLIIMLGDYIDRGPASAKVIDHLMAPPPAGTHRICLAGNHEMTMLDYLDRRIARSDWTRLGGDRTLMSYGIDHEHLARLAGDEPERYDSMIRAMIPAEHVDFLRRLPVLVESPTHLFVHAGLQPGVPLDQQADEELMTIRSRFYTNADRLDHFVIHGHTPITEPQLEGRRLNLDTGAYFSGRLCAVRIWRNTGRFLFGRTG
ncbi:MAG: serine/threonine protein phosphatase [Rhizobiaceae bacterium]|nr:serine/threonine protein phosphatase [Rhizobiaceae bacterium]